MPFVWSCKFTQPSPVVAINKLVEVTIPEVIPEPLVEVVAEVVPEPVVEVVAEVLPEPVLEVVAEVIPEPVVEVVAEVTIPEVVPASEPAQAITELL